MRKEAFVLEAEPIGIQGATAPAIADATGAAIDVTDDGRIGLHADSLEAAGAARHGIADVPGDAVVVGGIYDAVVVELIEFFGVHVEIRPGRRGLLHHTRMHGTTPEGSPWRPGLGETVRVHVDGRNRDGLFETTMLAAVSPQNEGTHIAAEAQDPNHLQRQPGPCRSGRPLERIR